MNISVSIENGKILFNSSSGSAPKIRNKGKSLLDLPSSYTVIDIETTGLSSDYDDIIEIGAIKVRDDNVIDTYVSLIYNKEISDFITNLTGITTEMVRTAPKLKVVLKEFLTFLNDDIIIAHNANFDVNFIYDAVENTFGMEFKNDFVDTLRISRKVYPEFKTHRLKYLSAFLALNSKHAHRASSDCYTVLELYSKCKNKIINENIDLKPKKIYLKSSEIIAKEDAAYDEENPLYNKICVFTGTLEKMGRKEAMQAVVNIGGLVGDGINSKTNYLIMGIQDYSKLADGKESSKNKKAKTLIEKGQDLKIISEHEFYELIFGIDINYIS